VNGPWLGGFDNAPTKSAAVNAATNVLNPNSAALFGISSSAFVGASVGALVGAFVGASVVASVGGTVGSFVGAGVGLEVRGRRVFELLLVLDLLLLNLDCFNFLPPRSAGTGT